MKQKTRLIEEAERLEIAAMYDAGNTLTEIVELTGRHHSAVSQVLRSAELKTSFKSRPRIIFTTEEMQLMRSLAEQGLSAAQIAKQMPGRRKETINGKLQALGYNRSLALSLETKAMIVALRETGHTIYEIAEITGVPKSTVATIRSVDDIPNEPSTLHRRVIEGDICRIYTSRGHEILVDAADFDSLPQTSIYRGANGYAVARVDGIPRYLHRLILGNVPVDRVVDHINGNKLDNRRANLRIATHSENAQNAFRRGLGKEEVIGVRKTAKGYAVSINTPVGTYATKEEAAKAYDEAAKKTFGDGAMTNAKRGLLK